jgi:hypothetical protein
MSAFTYLEHLTDQDLSLLAATSGEPSDALRAEPDRIKQILAEPAVFDRIFGTGSQEAFLHASPFLVFAVLVHRVRRDLNDVRFINEWVGPGQRVPVFDIAALREFIDDPARRLFLAELLASYTHVASGSYFTRGKSRDPDSMRGSRGWRRHRFSELDPMHLIELLDVVAEPERASVYRRLGDLALFLTGVFPEYTGGGRLLSPVARERLRRRLLWSEGELPAALELFELIGRRAYQAASKATQRPGLLDDLGGQGFARSRRVLNFLTDRYLFPLREQWFPFAA